MKFIAFTEPHDRLVQSIGYIHTGNVFNISINYGDKRTNLQVLGEPRAACRPSRYLLTSDLMSSGVWLGTIRIENLPITRRGITVFSPASLKAPSMPRITTDNLA